jgi:hypothetical protein
VAGISSVISGNSNFSINFKTTGGDLALLTDAETSSNNAPTKVAGKKQIKINLAWLLLLALPATAFIVYKKIKNAKNI